MNTIRLVLYCCIVACAGMSKGIYADTLDRPEKSIWKKFGFTLGYSYKLTNFKLRNYDTKREYSHFEQVNAAPFFEIVSPDFILGLKRSLVFKWGYSQSTVSQQVFNGNKVDLGASMNIKYSYLMPYISYNVSDVVATASNKNGFWIGGGVGYATTTIDGTAVYNNTGNTESNRVYMRSLISFIECSASYRYQGFDIGLKFNHIFNRLIMEVYKDLPPDKYEIENRELSAYLDYTLYF